MIAVQPLGDAIASMPGKIDAVGDPSASLVAPAADPDLVMARAPATDRVRAQASATVCFSPATT
jgi:hypothetical protein